MRENGGVNVLPSHHSQNPVGRVKRWSKKEKISTLIDILSTVQAYNRNIGGTNRMNQNINAYRTGIRGKNWLWSLSTWMLDAAVHSTCQIARSTGSSIDHLPFRRKLAMAYISFTKQSQNWQKITLWTRRRKET